MIRKLLGDTSSKENARKSAQIVGNPKEVNVGQQRKTISENLGHKSSGKFALFSC